MRLYPFALGAAFLLSPVACSRSEPTPSARTVGTTAGAAAPSGPEVKGRRIDVKVTNAGYEPSSISVKAGEEITLVFTRAEAGECGAEVTFPSLGIRKSLPLGQPVAIALRPEQPGEIAFACGMGMLRGALVVTAP